VEIWVPGLEIEVSEALNLLIASRSSRTLIYLFNKLIRKELITTKDKAKDLIDY